MLAPNEANATVAPGELLGFDCGVVLRAVVQHQDLEFAK